MESHVRNLMVVGKLFLISILMVIGVTAHAGPPSVEGPLIGDYQYNPLRAISDILRNRASYLNDADKDMYVQAISIALNQTQNGEIVEWWSRLNNGNHGYVRVIHTYPTGTGYCRVYQSQIDYENQRHQYTERACVQQGVSGWQYYR